MSILRLNRNCFFAFICVVASAVSPYAGAAMPAPRPSGQPRLPFLRRYVQPANRAPASTPPTQARLPFLRRYTTPRTDIKISRETPGTVHGIQRSPAGEHISRRPINPVPRGRINPPVPPSRPLASYPAKESDLTQGRKPAAVAPANAYSASPSGPTNLKLAPLHPALQNEKDGQRTIKLDMTRRYLNR
jgi:hypothetical protein